VTDETRFESIEEVEAALRAQSYLPERGLSTALFVSMAIGKPLLLEGEAGVGKTEASKALAAALGARLIRLQCYEGLDVAHAVYEWNYARQLLHIRAAQEGSVSEEELFGREFLIERPLLEAIGSDEPVVLLIDEIDRADEEFEAFLLEVLSDFQITIPELGTIRAHAGAARRAQAPLPVSLDHPSHAAA
jgi:MoxR-like ATPase